jgi:hypothetical protein
MKKRIIETPNDSIRLRGMTNLNDGKLENVSPPLPDSNHFFSIVLGMAGGGKSSLIQSLLSDPNAYKCKFSRIYWFSPSVNTLDEKFKDKLNPERLYTSLEALPEVIESLRTFEGDVLMIFDDMVRQIQEDSKTFMPLAFNRRHILKRGGISLMIVSQKTRSIPLFLRSAVDSVYVVGGSLRNKRELDAVFEDYTSSFMDRPEFDMVARHIAESHKHPFMFVRVDNGEVFSKFNSIRIE